MNLQEQLEAMIRDTIRNFGNELLDSLDSRIYMSDEHKERAASYALRDVRDAVQSAIEESVGIEP